MQELSHLFTEQSWLLWEAHGSDLTTLSLKRPVEREISPPRASCCFEVEPYHRGPALGVAEVLVLSSVTLEDTPWCKMIGKTPLAVSQEIMGRIIQNATQVFMWLGSCKWVQTEFCTAARLEKGLDVIWSDEKPVIAVLPVFMCERYTCSNLEIPALRWRVDSSAKKQRFWYEKWQNSVPQEALWSFVDASDECKFAVFKANSLRMARTSLRFQKWPVWE